MDAKRLRDLAAQALRDAATMAEAGHAQLAERAVALARELLAEAGPWTSAEHSDTLPPVTNAERALRESRGLAISRGKADDWFGAAFADKGWSQRRYARHIGVAPSTLSAWRSGISAIPRTIADRIAADIGIRADKRAWPAGIDENR